MNEKEKKAIEIIKDEIDRYKAIETPKEVYITDIKILLSIIEKQQKEIEELKENSIKVIDYEQGLKKIIDAEDDPDTWAYHAVQKLLKEVRGGNYEQRNNFGCNTYICK